MNKFVIIAIFAVVLIGVGIVYNIYFRAPEIAPIKPTGNVVEINITANKNKWDPTLITVKAGDTVKFINNDSSPRWPASGSHPTHQICPGFDALHGLNNGDSYSFTFNTAKTCPWHDHLKPAINGNIEVTP